MILVFSLFLSGPLLADWVGNPTDDWVGNPKSKYAEGNFRFIFRNLQDLLAMCLRQKQKCQLNRAEQELVRKIFLSMPREKKNELVFSANQAVFRGRDGKRLLARTNPLIGERVYINLQKIYQLDQRVGYRTYSHQQVLAVLLGQFALHHEIFDQQWLSEFSLRLSEALSVVMDSRVSGKKRQLVSSVLNFPDRSTKVFLRDGAQDGRGIYELSNDIRRLLHCPTYHGPARATGFRIQQAPFWWGFWTPEPYVQAQLTVYCKSDRARFSSDDYMIKIQPSYFVDKDGLKRFRKNGFSVRMTNCRQSACTENYGVGDGLSQHNGNKDQ